MATKPPPDLSTSILAALPSPPVLSAIGEYYIRFAQLEAWLDVMAGALLEIDWPATQSITANLNMHAKIDMLRSLIALRIKKHGDTPSRQTLDKLLQEAASINDHRAALAHSRFILPSEAGGNHEFVKSRANHKHIRYRNIPATELRFEVWRKTQR